MHTISGVPIRRLYSAELMDEKATLSAGRWHYGPEQENGGRILRYACHDDRVYL